MQMDSFQENPFMTTEQRDKMAILEMKDQANKLIPDPPAEPPRNGPSSNDRFDQGLPITIGDLTRFNSETLRPMLEKLVHTTYFKYYKVDLDAQCPYWVMNRMCTSGGGCTVCECDENEIPLPWRIEPTNKIVTHKREELPFNLENGVANHIWSDAEKEQDMRTSTYVNLIENPESNTGYQGEEPRRIWDAIYNENCFAMIGKSNVQDMCLEDRMMYRLISGLHGSISAHVFSNWKRDGNNEWIYNQFLWNKLFTPTSTNVDSVDVITQEILTSDARIIDRINNMMFTLELLLDSVSILREVQFVTKSQKSHNPHANAFVIHTGNEEEDQITVDLLNQLVQFADNRFQTYHSHELHASSANHAAQAAADTTGAVSGEKGDDDSIQQSHNSNDIFFSPIHNVLTTLEPDHVNNMRLLFHNVSVIMNCVGCEKCRIWSKLNILGITTSLKINSESNPQLRLEKILSLRRNELIALINTLNSLSQSVHYVATLSNINHDRSAITSLSATSSGGSSQLNNDGKDTSSPVRGNTAILLILMTIGVVGFIVYRTTSSGVSLASVQKSKAGSGAYGYTKSGRVRPAIAAAAEEQRKAIQKQKGLTSDTASPSSGKQQPSSKQSTVVSDGVIVVPRKSRKVD